MTTTNLTWFAALTLSAGICVAAPLGTAFTYQGKLADGGQPANGNYDLKFSLYNAASGPAQVGSTLTNLATLVTNGYFSVTLDFGSVFDGDARWLEIGVRTNGGGAFATLSPRQPLTAAPYALYAPTAGAASTASTAYGVVNNAVTSAGIASGQVVKSLNALRDDVTLAPGTNLSLTASGNTLTLATPTDWHVGGNSDTTAGPNFLGTTDNQALELKVNGQRALRLEPNTGGGPNVIGGHALNRVTPGVYSATIAGGGSAGNAHVISTNGGTISGGTENQVLGLLGTVGGGKLNIAGGAWATVAGGHGNLASGSYAAIGGGNSNSVAAETYRASIGGGLGNTILTGADGATIGGGVYNTASGAGAFVGGGGWDGVSFGGNVAEAAASVISGGIGNMIHTNAQSAAIGGGWKNAIQGYAPGAVIAGGGYNMILTNSYGATISGGEHNHVLFGANDATIGGGWINWILSGAHSATIGGGVNNSVLSNAVYATISGGQNNEAGPLSSVGGGLYNRASGEFATISGGLGNVASNSYDAVVGGTYNVAAGLCAFVGGGSNNVVQSSHAVIAGGWVNSIGTDSESSAIGGGLMNTIQTDVQNATIAGGRVNTIETDAWDASVGGGYRNAIQSNSISATIGGGRKNTIQPNSQYATIGGGIYNVATGIASTIGGGDTNAIGSNSGRGTIAGGDHNTIQGNSQSASIGGGYYNVISNDAFSATIAGGGWNAVGNNAIYASISGGYYNLASGNFSFAAGQQAQALHAGSFVWADSTSGAFASTSPNQFSVRANGGVRLVTGGAGLTVDGVSITPGGGGTIPDNSVTAAKLASDAASLAKVTAGNAYVSNGRIGIGTASPSEKLQVDYGNLLVHGAGNFTPGTDALLYLGDYNNYVKAIWGVGLRFGAASAADGLVLNNGGNVGIGTTSPTDRLQVDYGNLWVRGLNNFAAFTDALLYLGDHSYYAKATWNTGLRFGVPSADDAVVIRNGGNVGIGTFSPGRRLHIMDGVGNNASIQVGGQVAGSDPKLIYFGDSAFVYLGENVNDDTLELHATRFYFSGGYLGIGVSLPSYPIHLAGGAYCDGAQWQNYSDRHAKENFTPVDARTILEKVAALPISTWNYQGQTNGAKHLGPMAQDFHAAFGLGHDDRSIGTVDEGGVALAAIQGLNQKLEETRAELKRREVENAALNRRLERLERQLTQVTQNGQ